MNAIHRLRKSNNLTQTDLAGAVDVSQAAIANWETGKTFPTTDKLPKLAKVLNCKIEDLFGDVENKGVE